MPLGSAHEAPEPYTNTYAKVVQTVRMVALFRKHEWAVIESIEDTEFPMIKETDVVTLGGTPIITGCRVAIPCSHAPRILLAIHSPLLDPEVKPWYPEKRLQGY